MGMFLYCWQMIAFYGSCNISLCHFTRILRISSLVHHHAHVFLFRIERLLYTHYLYSIDVDIHMNYNCFTVTFTVM
jgi:hypothetical protein